MNLIILNLYIFFQRNFAAKVSAGENKSTRPSNPLPIREHHIKNLKTNSEYDVVVIGGGATGAGIALDAVSRGWVLNWY